MNIDELLKSYLCGDYKNCLQIISGNSINKEIVKIKQDIVNFGNLNDISAELLLKNNEAICMAIMQLDENEHKWLESLQCFIKLHSNYKSLPIIPVELEMNIVYNILWWLWIRPRSLLNTSYYMKIILKALSCCLIKVLKSNGDVILGQQMCLDNVSNAVSFLKKASDHLLLLKPVACIQLLDLITMTVLVFLRERMSEAAVECMTFMTKIVKQIDLLRLHTEPKEKSDCEVFYFKFGFKSVNSTAALSNSRLSIGAFIVICSLNCAVNREYELGVECFKELSEEENSYNFMVNYLKAHCHLMSQHLSEAKLCLAYVMSGQVPVKQMAHYRLLLARLLDAQGDHQAALVQCDAVLASHPAHSVLTSLAASLAARQACKLGVTTAELNYRKQLVQALKAGEIEDNGRFDTFEECCVVILSHQFYVSLPEALYTLSRQLYVAGYHVKALESYTELLELVRTQGLQDPLVLPCQSQLIQECILAHIKSNSLPGGEQLCRQLVRDHLPHTGGGRDSCSEWEVTLYGMEDDVVTLMLLADILSAAGNKRNAVEELNRCQSSLMEWKEHTKSEADQQLCDWLLSRTLLRKARVSSTTDAAHYFRRALIHRPGDKEVMFHYKQWSLWHPDHESFDPGDASAAVTFPADDIHNLAVRHILVCSVSDEEWNHLFELHTSQNIIESLFDDDED